MDDNTNKHTNVMTDVANSVLNIKKRLKNITEDNKAKSSTGNKTLSDIEKNIKANATKMKDYGVDEHSPQFIKNQMAELVENLKKEQILTQSTVQQIYEGSETDQEVEKETTKKFDTSAEEMTPEQLKEKKLKEKLLDRKTIKSLGPSLKKRVFGQDETINQIVTILTNAALGIQINKQKPAGCYFFAGPSGVGKTELATSIADEIKVPILKINMGEYGLEQDITKLIGTSKGYVGYNEGGLLTNFVSENPKCIVLFDEIEKAHPSMNKILLSIMDHGTCTDNKGNEVIFKNTIVISTSNIGAEIEYDQTLTKEEKAELRMEAIKEKLAPEIINRYDGRFDFNALTPENYRLIVEKFLNQLNKSMLEEHEFSLKYTEKLIDFIVEKSHDPAMGGRPARRFIEQIVIQKLAENMLEESFEEVAKDAKQITLDINSKGNICFKAKNKVLGVLENTAELVASLESKRFTRKPKP